MPLFPKAMRTGIYVPEKAFPQNREGRDCECMNREYLLTYKKGRIRWLRKAGDTVRRGEIIAEAEIEKRIFEVPAPCDGVLAEICMEEGVRFACSDVLGYIE